MISGALGSVAVCLFFNLNIRRIGWAFLASLLTLGVYVGMLVAFDYNNSYVFFDGVDSHAVRRRFVGNNGAEN